MKSLFYILIYTSSITLFGQKIKNEDLSYSKVYLPTILNLDQPIDINIQFISSTDYIKNIIKSANIYSTTDFSNNNSSNPKYIAVVDYIYKEPYSFHEKKSLNTIVIKSKIDAILYLIEAGKGVFNTDTIKSNERPFIIDKLVSDAEVSAYFLNGIFPNPEKITQVDRGQVINISDLAKDKIREKLTTTKENKKIELNNLKSDKEFNSNNFSKAFEIITKNLEPLNNDKLTEAINLFQIELDHYKDNSEKKINKYKIAILENILRLSFLTDSYQNIDNYKSSMNSLDSKNFVLKWYLSKYESYKKRNESSQLNQSLTYTDIPEKLFNTSNNKTALTQAENVNDERINKLDVTSYYEYIDPVFSLNNILFYLKALKNERLLDKYQNDIFNEIIWYMFQHEYKIKKLRNSETKLMQDFITFSKEFNKITKEKNVYKMEDEKSVKLMKLREYVSLNYTIQDFTKFIPAIENTIKAATSNTRKELVEGYLAATNLSSIMQTRNLIAKDDYMESERKSYEKILDDMLEANVKNPIFKNKSYYEFKKSIDLIKNMEFKRSFTEEELENYKILMINIVSKLLYNA